MCRSKRSTVVLSRYKVADEGIDEDADPGVGQGTETLALSVGGDSDVRALYVAYPLSLRHLKK